MRYLLALCILSLVSASQYPLPDGLWEARLPAKSSPLVQKVELQFMTKPAKNTKYHIRDIQGTLTLYYRNGKKELRPLKGIVLHDQSIMLSDGFYRQTYSAAGIERCSWSFQLVPQASGLECRGGFQARRSEKEECFYGMASFKKVVPRV